MKLNTKFTPRQLGIILILAIIVVLVIAVVSVIPTSKEEPQKESISLEIPDGDIPDEDNSKIASYEKRSISSHWDALEEEDIDDLKPTAGKDGRSGGGGASSGRADNDLNRELDDLLKDTPVEDAPKEDTTPKAKPAPRKSSGGSGGSSTQRPKKDSEKTETKKEEKPAIPAAKIRRSDAISTLDDDHSSLGDGFSSLDSNDSFIQQEEGKPYQCMFSRDEKIRSGQRVSVRLMEDIVVGRHHIAKNTHLQGICSIEDRLQIKITSLDLNGKIIPLRFVAYDTDGSQGIYCTDISKTKDQVTDQALNTGSTLLTSRVGTIAQDVANLGVSIIRSKTGEVTVKIPAGYVFYLIEEKEY